MIALCSYAVLNVAATMSLIATRHTPRADAAWMRTHFSVLDSTAMNEPPIQVQPRPIYTAVKPVRDPNYLRFIKRLPCVACLKTWWVDPCHTGPHGMGQKSAT